MKTYTIKTDLGLALLHCFKALKNRSAKLKPSVRIDNTITPIDRGRAAMFLRKTRRKQMKDKLKDIYDQIQTLELKSKGDTALDVLSVLNILALLVDELRNIEARNKRGHV